MAKTASLSVLNADEDGLLAYLGHDGEVSASANLLASGLKINNALIVSQAKALQNVTSISGAGVIQGNNLSLGGGKVTTTAAGQVNGLALSGTAQLESAKLKIDNQVIVSQARALGNVTTIYGASRISGNDLALGGGTATISAAGAVAGTSLSGTTKIESAKLDIDGSTIITQARALGNVTTISGASSLAGAKLTINGSDIVTQAKALGNVTTISGAGRIQGNDLRLGGGNVVLKESGRLSGSENLLVGGTVRLDGVADTAVNQAADSIYFLDSDNLVKRDTIVAFVAAIAGSGLSAGSGKLSTQGSAVETQFNTNQALHEGYNVYTGSGDVTVQLEDRPAGNLTAGDIFVIKQGATGKVTISSSSPETTIDGVSGSVLLESPFAAVNLLFVDYGRGGPKFRIV